MKQRFRLYRRKRGGRFYVHDSLTGKQDSLGTSDRAEAWRLLHARNEAEQQPAVNLQIARAYLAASDPQVATTHLAVRYGRDCQAQSRLDTSTLGAGDEGQSL